LTSAVVPEAPGTGVAGDAPVLPVVPVLLPSVLLPNVLLPGVLLPNVLLPGVLLLSVVLPVVGEPKVLLPRVLLAVVVEEPGVPVAGEMLPVVLPRLPKVLVQGAANVEPPVVFWAAANEGKPAMADAASAAASCVVKMRMFMTPEGWDGGGSGRRAL
jgi:hypothetical protein